MHTNKCKICRRAGTKLFLKGERCLSPKCAMNRKPYPPGMRAKRRRSHLSEYGKELKEKQKLRNWYNLGEKQFRGYVGKVLEKRGHVEDAGALLIQNLEKRLDNVVFRMGFASSRVQSRQLVNHGHFLVNKKRVSIPSYQVKKDDVITLSANAKKKTIFENITDVLKKYKAPSWIDLNADKLEAKIIGEPSLEETAPPAEISSIFEFYSK